MNILNEIAEKTRERIERDKKEMPREDLINEIRQKKVQMLLNPLIQSETAKTPHSFYQALKKPGRFLSSGPAHPQWIAAALLPSHHTLQYGLSDYYSASSARPEESEQR